MQTSITSLNYPSLSQLDGFHHPQQPITGFGSELPGELVRRDIQSGTKICILKHIPGGAEDVASGSPSSFTDVQEVCAACSSVDLQPKPLPCISHLLRIFKNISCTQLALKEKEM